MAKAKNAGKVVTIIIPEPVTVTATDISGKRVPVQTNIGTDNEPKIGPDRPWNMLRYLERWVFSRESWKKLTASRVAGKVIDALLDDPDATKLQLPYDSWTRIKDDIEADDFEIPFPFGVQLVCYADAIIEGVVTPIDEAKKPADEESE